MSDEGENGNGGAAIDQHRRPHGQLACTKRRFIRLVIKLIVPIVCTFAMMKIGLQCARALDIFLSVRHGSSAIIFYANEYLA